MIFSKSGLNAYYILRNMLFSKQYVYTIFQEKFQFNDAKNVMWCNHQIEKKLNVFPKNVCKCTHLNNYFPPKRCFQVAVCVNCILNVFLNKLIGQKVSHVIDPVMFLFSVSTKSILLLPLFFVRL